MNCINRLQIVLPDEVSGLLSDEPVYVAHNNPFVLEKGSNAIF